MKNLLPNCPISKANILTAEHIFGPDVGSLKGKKTTKQQPNLVRNTITPLPPIIAMLSRYHPVHRHDVH
jgi:hypothetical protein